MSTLAEKQRNIVKAIKAIADGYHYEFSGSYGAYLVVDNPTYQPDDGSDPHIVVELVYGTRMEA